MFICQKKHLLQTHYIIMSVIDTSYNVRAIKCVGDEHIRQCISGNVYLYDAFYEIQGVSVQWTLDNMPPRVQNILSRKGAWFEKFMKY